MRLSERMCRNVALQGFGVGFGMGAFNSVRVPVLTIMKALVCSNCGAHDWKEVDGYRVCTYCGTRVLISEEEKGRSRTEIALDSDVERLLKKCRTDPKHAAKYANLILDIDPTNAEARKYL